MRRVAALYDVHGNLPALEAALAAAEAWGADMIVSGGDVVLGPMPRECLARLMSLGPRVQFLSGNCDRLVLDATAARLDRARLPAAVVGALNWVAAQLTPEDCATLAGWPAAVSLEVEGCGQVYLCHATPRSDEELFTDLTPEDRVASMFAAVLPEVTVVVCGHTHLSFERRVAGRRIVNAGSVGLPYDGPGAAWLALGPDVELRRTVYDRVAAADRIRATAYPDAATYAAEVALATPTAAEMRAAFERAAATAALRDHELQQTEAAQAREPLLSHLRQVNADVGDHSR